MKLGRLLFAVALAAAVSATAADVTIDNVTYDVVYSAGEPSYAAIKYGKSYTGSELTIPATIICYE